MANESNAANAVTHPHDHSRVSGLRQPFGPRVLDAAHLAREARMRARQERARETCLGQVECKHRLIRALTEARHAFGVSDRSIIVLEALASCHRGRALDGRTPLIVYPSNRELSLRCRGMAPATLRRHIAALVHAGLIARRDSPNGKRFRRRDGPGTGAGAGMGEGEAYGFDLAPLALAAPDIEAAATAARAAWERRERMRLSVVTHARDIAKTLEALAETAVETEGFRIQLDALGGTRRIARGVSYEALKERCEALARLRIEVERAFLATLNEAELDAAIDEPVNSEVDGLGSMPSTPCEDRESSGCGAQPERHQQSSSTQYPLNGSREAIEEREGRAPRTAPNATRREMDGGSGIVRPAVAAPGDLDRVRRACPLMADLDPAPIATWSDFLRRAETTRAMLGISPDAWGEARAAMGERTAATVVAAMLERHEHIRKPGGYLRALTEKAETNGFDINRMLRALENRE